jgi:hypothetical protein
MATPPGNPPPEDTRQLHRAYQSKDVGELAAYYDEWSEDYEAHMRNIGYMHPAMVTSMVGRHVEIDAGPVLDAGAGTGIMGEILTALGQTAIGRLVFSVARSYLEGPFDTKRKALEDAGAWSPVDSTKIYNSAPLGDELLSRVFVYEAS